MREAYHSVNSISILTYWNVGKRIVEEEQQGASRAEYGKQVLKGLAQILVPLFGSSYNERNLYSMRQLENVIKEMQSLTQPLQQGRDEIVKNPVVAEFLGLENTDYTESDLEYASSLTDAITPTFGAI